MRYRQKTKTFTRKKVLIVLVVLVIFGAAGFFVTKALHFGPFSNNIFSDEVGQPTKSIDYNPPNPDQTKAGEAAKQQAENGAQGSDPPLPPTPPTSGTSKSQVAMEVTAANVDNGTFYLRTLIQAISNTGVCNLTATGPNGKTYSASASIQAGPSTSTCQGFNIPLSSLSPGSWKFQITFENDTLRANASVEKTL